MKPHGNASLEMAFPTSDRDLDDLATVPLWSDREPNAAAYLRIGRTAAYTGAQTGDIPTIRVGRLIRVPVVRLRALLTGEAS
jgi:hypothetical protein